MYCRQLKVQKIKSFISRAFVWPLATTTGHWSEIIMTNEREQLIRVVTNETINQSILMSGPNWRMSDGI